MLLNEELKKKSFSSIKIIKKLIKIVHEIKISEHSRIVPHLNREKKG